MECRKFENKLIHYLEGSLTSEEMNATRQHLEVCSSCSEKLEYLKVHANVMEEYKTTEVKPFLYTRIHAKLDSEVIPAQRRILVPLFAVSVLTLGLFFGSLLGKYTMAPVNDQIAADYEVAYLFNEMNLESAEYRLLNE